MEVPPGQDFTRPAHPFAPILTFGALFLSAPAAAQERPRVAPRPVADSAHAVATACSVVGALRPGTERYRCRVESYAETSTEFVLRLREQAPSGGVPPVFAESEVRLNKSEPSVIVTRVPDL